IQTEYARKKDQEYQQKTDRFFEEFNKEKEQFEKKMLDRERGLDEREAYLDDMDTRGARRARRNDILLKLKNLSDHFVLTKDTRSKRIVIHAVFIFLLAIFGTYIS